MTQYPGIGDRRDILGLYIIRRFKEPIGNRVGFLLEKLQSGLRGQVPARTPGVTLSAYLSRRPTSQGRLKAPPHTPASPESCAREGTCRAHVRPSDARKLDVGVGLTIRSAERCSVPAVTVEARDDSRMVILVLGFVVGLDWASQRPELNL